MAFCPSCGSAVDGRFCPKCGAEVGASGPGAGASGVQAPSLGGLTDNMASALCYVLGLVTGILFLVLAPYNQNKGIRFHAWQSIFLNIAVLVIDLGVYPALAMVTGGMFYFTMPIFGLACFLLWLFLIWKAYQGQKFVLPIIGAFAEKQA